MKQRDYRSWSSERLGIMIAVYSKPGLILLFGKQLEAMGKELLSRALPDYAFDVGGHLVAAPLGVQ